MIEKILIIDDDKISLRLYEKIFSKNYSLETAQNGLKGLEKLHHFTPDLILCDLMMPEINGFEFTKIVRRDPNFKKLKIMIVSAKNDLNDRLLAFESGADDFLGKPFSIHELKAKVKNLLKFKSLEEINQFKSDILQLVSHELRTPLTIISGFTDLLIFKAPENCQKELDRIQIASKTLGNFIQKILIFSDLKSGKALEFLPLDLPHLTQNVIQNLGNKLEFFHLTVDFPVNFPIIHADRDRVTFCLKEILLNAIKFSNQEKIIQIKGELMENRVKITISNSGDIRQSSLDEMFKDFQTTNLSHHHAGNRLSLAICKEIMRQHQGEISCNYRNNMVSLPLLFNSNLNSHFERGLISGALTEKEVGK